VKQDELKPKIPSVLPAGAVGYRVLLSGGFGLSLLESNIREGENPVFD